MTNTLQTIPRPAIPAYYDVIQAEQTRQKAIGKSTIPVVNLDDYFSNEPLKKRNFLNTVEEAAKTYGFFAVQDSRLDGQLIDEAYNVTRAYFSRSKNEKMGDHYKEFYHIGRKDIKWPKTGPQDFQDTITRLVEHLHQLGSDLSQAFSEILNQFIADTAPGQSLRNVSLNSSVDDVEGVSLLRLLHYPAAKKGEVVGAQHTDIDMFTILPKSTAQGLQILKDGNWIDVEVPDGTYIVNIGDYLTNMTNGLWKSSIHRVISDSEDADRHSIVYFIHGTLDTDYSPFEAAIQATGGKQSMPKAVARELLFARQLELGLANDFIQQFLKDSTVIPQLICHGRASKQLIDWWDKNAPRGDGIPVGALKV